MIDLKYTSQYPRTYEISLKVTNDDADIDEVMNAVAYFLLAVGYTPSTINDRIDLEHPLAEPSNED